jgi:ribokinase
LVARVISLTDFDVVGFGALNVDKLSYVNLIAKEDEESYIYNSKISCGGSAANTIVGLARLRLKTGFLGSVAEDGEGRLLLSELKKENVDIERTTRVGRGTSGTVMGFVDVNGSRALYVDPGVNDSIILQDSDIDYCKNSRFLHLSSFVGDTSFKSQIKLVREIPDNVKVSLDPGMLYSRKGMLTLKPLIKHCYAVLLNENELRLLTGKNFEVGTQMLLAEGVKIVGVKMGVKGCFITDGANSYKAPSFRVAIVDTTGAGDAWNAGCIYGLLNKKTLLDCGKLGNFVAAKCITKAGARNGLPYISDIKQSNLLKID